MNTQTTINIIILCCTLSLFASFAYKEGERKYHENYIQLQERHIEILEKYNAQMRQITGTNQ